MTTSGGRDRRRRGRAVLVAALLVAVGAVVLVTTDAPPGPAGPIEAPGPTARAGPMTFDDVLDAVATDPDGSVTVRLDDDEAAGLVASALDQGSVRRLRDVSVALVEPEDGSDGRMVVSGRLDEPSLPVEAVVDLRVVDAAVRPTVRALRVGPVPLPDGTREDLDRQIRELALVAGDRFVVERLSTADGVLTLTGRRR